MYLLVDAHLLDERQVRALRLEGLQERVERAAGLHVVRVAPEDVQEAREQHLLLHCVVGIRRTL